MPRKYIQLLMLFALLIIVSLVLINISLKNKTNIITPSTDTPTVSISEKKDSEEIPLLTTIAENLEVPWAIAFLPASTQRGKPDGSMLVTERPGRVRFINKDGRLNPNPIAQIEDVKPIGEGGLLGIAIHPQFPANNFVYLYYTYAGSTDQTLNRVARFKFENNTFTEKTTIVDEIPGAPNHNGGRIKFGPDKMLYITTGDAQNPSLAQDPNSLAGKILRVTDKGEPAPNNPLNDPLADGGRKEIYSWGHRNPQGITWDDKGRLWETEHGSTAFDELNLITSGNYGWPSARGDDRGDGLFPPILHSGQDTWAPGGAAYLNGSIFFAGLRGQALYETVIKNNNDVELKEHFKGEFGRIREVVVGPDNMLYFATSNRDGRGKPDANDDKIIRVNPLLLSF